MPDQNEVDNAIAVMQAHEAELLALPNVNGMDVGFKYIDGQMTDTIAIRVFVDTKLDGQATNQVPPQIENVQTDVMVRTHVVVQLLGGADATTGGANRGHFDTIEGGISIGACRRGIDGNHYGGTLGAIMENASGHYFALSNWHVICLDDTWHLGDTVVQQAMIDSGNCGGGRLGVITAGCLNTRYSCGFSVDAALSSIEHRRVSPTILNIGTVTGSAAPVLGSHVRKQGRTSGLTSGIIDGVAGMVSVGYPLGVGTITFTNQISIVPGAGNPPFLLPGDSGSALVNDAGQIVGLCFASDDINNRAYANTFSDVAASLGVTPMTHYPWTSGHQFNSVDRTPRAVAMGSFGGNLYAAWKADDSSNHIYISGTNNPMGTWPNGHTINGSDRTSQQMSMAEFGGNLWLAWKADDSSNRIYITGTNNPMGPWPGGHTINGSDSTPRGPAIASYGGRLYMAWKANDSSNKIYISGTNNPNGVWPNGVTINSIDCSPDAVAMAEYGGLLYMVWKANDSSNRIYISATNNPLGGWPNGLAIDTADSTPVTLGLASHGGELFLSWKANDSSNKIYFSHTNDPLHVWPDGLTMNTIDSTPLAPVIEEFGGNLYMMWKANDSGDHIYISQYTP